MTQLKYIIFSYCPQYKCFLDPPLLIVTIFQNEKTSQKKKRTAIVLLTSNKQTEEAIQRRTRDDQRLEPGHLRFGKTRHDHVFSALLLLLPLKI